MKKIYKVKVNGKTYQVELQGIDEVATKDAPVAAAKTAPAAAAPVATGEGKPVPSPIQGTVVDVKVKSGDTVKKGQVLLIIEAMKLENEVVAPVAGVVGDVLATKGATVSAKQTLLTIK
ncbi:MAG: biotin/lipoyl-binding protein [Bacilli bacterium]|nr:biotin/lipoyl-binding protein [Bacilli bacterium]